MPVFSLPNKYGIGSFGDEAYRFVDFLAAAGQSYWQVLPLSPTAYGDSPYQSPSAFAGNPYFIDLDLLRMDGLLTDEECRAEQTKDKAIDYAKLYERRYAVLKKAFVPPDAFSADGQLWGNPLYDWDAMKKDGFAWWKKRFKAALDMYDVVRIDHFRGFSDYYAIPFGQTTARNGTWKSAPGKELFATLKTEFPDANIIAEDLGVIDDRVRELLRLTGFPGMKIAQFGFSEENSGYNPRNYPKNCVAYTGTHDNPTTAVWAKNLNGTEKIRFRKYVRRRIGETDATALVRSLLCSEADVVVIPMQDYLSLGEKGRVNTPSTLGRNWIWRLKPHYTRHANRIKRMCALR